MMKLGAVLLAIPLLALVTAWTVSAVDAEAAPAANVNVSEETVEVTADAVVGADEFALVANNCTYYNNASHSQIVGQFGYDCCYNAVAWGRKTRSYGCGGCFPCFPPPPW
jgi:hypothetical protein